ncbi:MAG: hypothetical protein WAW92_03470 [Minisyncoccia bacterium]
MSFFSRKNSVLSIVVDIGSGSLSVALVYYEKEKPPTILHTISRDFTIANKPSSDKILLVMTKALDEALSQLVKVGMDHPKVKKTGKILNSVNISLSSPWFLPRTKYIDIKKDKEFIVNENFIKSITISEADAFREKIKNDDKTTDEPLEVIESKVVDIKVNGYVISRVGNQKTNALTAHLCMALVNKSLIERVDTIVAKNTHIDKDKIVFHTFPVATFSVVRDLFNQYQDFILLDVTSEVTDLSLVSNDVLIKTVAIPSGRNFIIRQIAKKFDMPVEIAESNLSTYSLQKLDKDTSGKIEEVLIDIEKEWSIYLERALLDLSPELSLPNHLYMTSQSDVADVYLNYLKLSKADSTATFRKNLNVVRVQDKILSGLYNNESHTTPNEFICLIAIYYNKFVFK